MSYNDTKVQKFICPFCSLPRPSAICGSCTSQRLEAIRNSVIENERKNQAMRQQISSIFGEVYGFLPIEDENLQNIHGIPIPTSSAVGKLKSSIKKLDLRNLKSKQLGVQKTSDALERKTKVLRAEIDRQKLQNIELKQSLENRRVQVVDTVNAKVVALDKELATIKHKADWYINRQSASMQLSQFRVIREAWLVGPSLNVQGLRYGPILQLQDFTNSQIGTVNTFLEDCIQLQIILFDLFSITDSQLELPYLRQLQKHLPESEFYDSVQQKIKTLVNDYDDEEPSPQADTVVSPERKLENVDKITFKNNVLQVPRSSRTMNLQRRSSVKPSDIAQAVGNFQEDSNSPKVNSSEGRSSELSPSSTPAKGKRIVIVPHKILKKPFSKLEPKEYLKFVSVVVKILVNFNCLLIGVSDYYGRNSSRSPSSSSPGNMFIYDFKKIFEKIYKLEDSIRPAGTEGHSSSAEKQASQQVYIDSLQSSRTTIGEDSFASSASQSRSSMAAPNGALQRIYNKYLLGRGGSTRQDRSKPREAGSNMDGIIYGIVSEAKIDKISESKIEHQKGAQVHLGKGSFELKDIVSRVHEIIASGGGGHRAFNRGAHSQEFETALSMMERSKVHLEDWDLVSRMY